MPMLDATLYIPLLYAAGAGLQALYALRPRRLPYALAWLGAVPVAAAALYERDVLLLVGQCFVLLLLHRSRT